MNGLTRIQPDNLELTRRAMSTPVQRRIDRLGKFMLTQPQMECVLKHEFTPGMYIRSLTMPKGALAVSKIHKTEHPYFILRGRVSVWIEGKGWITYCGGHRGITKPGTRRVLYVWEETEWVTVHVTDKTDVEEIERDVIFDPERDDASIEVKRNL